MSTSSVSTSPAAVGGRLSGVDVARAVAVLGIFAAHFNPGQQDRSTTPQPSPARAPRGAPMTTESARWAPWYVYLVTIIPANLIKQQFVADTPIVVNLAATIALVALVVAVVTWAWRWQTTKNPR